MCNLFPLFASYQNNKLSAKHHANGTNQFFQHHYECVDLNIFDVFQSIAVIILNHVPMVPSSASGSLFTLLSKSLNRSQLFFLMLFKNCILTFCCYGMFQAHLKHFLFQIQSQHFFKGIQFVCFSVGNFIQKLGFTVFIFKVFSVDRFKELCFGFPLPLLIFLSSFCSACSLT